MAGEPIGGQILLLTAAKASVPPARLPELIDRAQATLRPELESYRRRYECVYEGDDAAAFLVEWGHWEEIGERLEFTRRERSAVRRAHEEQLLRIGRSEGREAEFESALEIREPVLVATASRASIDSAETAGPDERPDSDGSGAARTDDASVSDR